MRIYWPLAVLFSTALVVGCGDRDAENRDNLEQTAAVPEAPGAAVDPQASPAAPPSQEDAPAVSGRRERAGARATSGTGRAEVTEPRHSAEAPQARSSGTSAPAPRRVPQYREVTVPAGTALPLDLMTALSSETATVETPVRARLRQALVVDGYTALPAGAVLTGTVIDVDRAGRVQGRSRLAFRFDEVQIDGTREDLRTNPIAFEGEATKGEDATKIGAGAGVGAIIGGILGGGDGAAKGAAIGGAAGTGAVLATRGREVTLASGTNIAATLAEPFTVRAPVR